MGWPTPQEYNEAIQNPLTAFEDPELRGGKPLLTPLGLPRPITGAFASVYQLATAKGRTVAVRCFLREFGDQQERYAAISAHLATQTAAHLPYMTNFTYLARGIRVNGRWYPVLKMDWIEGESLQTYVERNLNRPDVLRNLAEQWVQMAKLLRSAAIGHGDLQHGNVIVCGGQLRLIDYDGMYVPALAGRTSHEIGHRNYQHPARSERDFGPGIDHFSTWVVYTSLVALSVQPALWQSYSGGDECLIFRREDFERPAASTLLQSLENATDARLADLADIFHTVLLLPPDRVPPIDGPLAWPANGKAPTAALSLGRAGAHPAGGWVADHLGKAQPAAAAASNAAPVVAIPAGGRPAAPANGAGGANGAAPANAAAAAPAAVPAAAPAALPGASPAGDPSWIVDFIGNQQAAAVGFGSDFEAQRWAMLTPVVLAWIAWGAFQLFGLAYGVPAAVTVAAVVAVFKLIDGYWHDPSVQALWSDQRALREVQSQTRTVSRRVEGIERRAARAERKLDRRRQRMEASLQQSKAAEQEALARHDARLGARLAEAQRRRDLLVQAGADAVRRLQERNAARLANLDREIAGLHGAEDAELRQTLARRQQQFVADYMKRQTVEAAVIAGIGPTVKQTLRNYGIVRAMDLEARRLAQVEGIGEARARALLEWRRKAESLAAQTAPQSLSKVEETLIRARFYGRRFALEQEKSKAQQKLAKEIAEAQARTADQLKAADQEPQRLRQESAQQRDAIRARFGAARKQAGADLAALDQEIDGRQGAFDQEAAAEQVELASLNAQRAGIEYRLRRYDDLHFAAYVRRVLIG